MSLFSWFKKKKKPEPITLLKQHDPPPPMRTYREGYREHTIINEREPDNTVMHTLMGMVLADKLLSGDKSEAVDGFQPSIESFHGGESGGGGASGSFDSNDDASSSDDFSSSSDFGGSGGDD